MREKPFAKLFETPTTQVLVFFGSEENTECPKIYRWLHMNGVEVGLHISWKDDSDESFAKAQAAFDMHDQSAAERLAADVTNQFGELCLAE